MNYRKIAEEIVAEQVKPASNANGFRLYRLNANGQEIAWCAGALVDANDPGKPVREMTDFLESALRHGMLRMIANVGDRVRSQRARAAELRKESFAAESEATKLDALLDSLTAAAVPGEF